jgi:hypothetical protein
VVRGPNTGDRVSRGADGDRDKDEFNVAGHSKSKMQSSPDETTDPRGSLSAGGRFRLPERPIGSSKSVERITRKLGLNSHRNLGRNWPKHTYVREFIQNQIDEINKTRRRYIKSRQLGNASIV